MSAFLIEKLACDGNEVLRNNRVHSIINDSGGIVLLLSESARMELGNAAIWLFNGDLFRHSRFILRAPDFSESSIGKIKTEGCPQRNETHIFVCGSEGVTAKTRELGNRARHAFAKGGGLPRGGRGGL